MSLGSFLQGINSFFTAGGGNFITDLFNIRQQELNNERTMALQQKLWERDDTSVERLMKQYQSNGINPLMALPNISQGNTKGFETSSIQSRLDTQAMALANERQKLELDIMKNQEDRNAKLFEEEEKGKKYENDLLRAKVHGAKVYAKYYGAGLGYDFGEDGYIPPYQQRDYEKIAEIILTGFNNLHNGFSLFDKGNVEFHADKDLKTSIFKPNEATYKGQKIIYDTNTGKYLVGDKTFESLEKAKAQAQLNYTVEQSKKSKEKQQKRKEHFDSYFLPDEYYEPMYLNQ